MFRNFQSKVQVAFLAVFLLLYIFLYLKYCMFP